MPLVIDEGCEAVITCEFINDGYYEFYFDNEENYPNVTMELRVVYADGDEDWISDGEGIYFEYNSENIASVELRVHNGVRYDSFNGSISAFYDGY